MKKEQFRVRKTAAGLGLYTTVPIKKGARIIEYTGETITEEEANRRGGRYLFKLNSKRALDARRHVHTARYINHSCKPNCIPYLNDPETRVFIFAKRDILGGEELTYNYGNEYSAEYCVPCKCAECRKKAM